MFLLNFDNLPLRQLTHAINRVWLKSVEDITSHDLLAIKSPGYKAAGAESALEARFTGRCIVAGAVHAPAGGIGKSFPRILATLQSISDTLEVVVVSLNCLDGFSLNHPYIVVTQSKALDVGKFPKKSMVSSGKFTFLNLRRLHTGAFPANATRFSVSRHGN